jgi:hypothetical protein
MPFIAAIASWVPSSDVLLAVGVTLVVLGVVLRGFHQSNQRAASQRALTERFSRVAGKPESPDDKSGPPPFFVRHLVIVYSAVFLAGLALTLVGFSRR